MITSVTNINTNHSNELVEFWLEVRSPEVNVGSFVTHLVTAGRKRQKESSVIMLPYYLKTIKLP